MLRYDIDSPVQIPLIHVVDKDDQILLNSPDADWYKLLHDFPWWNHKDLAADYYNALYDFNKSRSSKNSIKSKEESKQDATQRLLFERATMNEEPDILFQDDYCISHCETVAPESIRPGKPPIRQNGRRPKCFFALFKSFIGTTLQGHPPEPEIVYSLLASNLSFARVCGFIPKETDERYWYKHVPAIRKLQQFDQIMTDYGLWDTAKWSEVVENIQNDIIHKENELVGDTTHYHARSGFKTIIYTDEKEKENKKSQSKTTKNCRCHDKENCPHPWELADDGAGTIVKAHNKFIWGHKASILGLPIQGIPLDAVAVSDAATYDGKTFFPHIERLFDRLPEIQPWIKRVLYDSACDDQNLKDKFERELGVELKASMNPRRRQTITTGLPKGMKKLSPYGVLTCKADHEMDYKGIRYEAEKFIYQAPVNEKNICACSTCGLKNECCPKSKQGRVVNIPFEDLSHINPCDPPMAKRFKAIMTRRPSVERMIKRLKCDLSDDRLKKRGNKSFQAYLDKTMIAFHILLRR